MTAMCVYIRKKKKKRTCREAAWKMAMTSSVPVTSYPPQKLCLLTGLSFIGRAGLKAAWQGFGGSKLNL